MRRGWRKIEDAPGRGWTARWARAEWEVQGVSARTPAAVELHAHGGGGGRGRGGGVGRRNGGVGGVVRGTPEASGDAPPEDRRKVRAAGPSAVELVYACPGDGFGPSVGPLRPGPELTRS